MNLVTRLISRDIFIEGMHKEDIKNILTESHPSIKIKIMRHGNIILNNYKIIKCIGNYYADSNGKHFKKPKSTNTCYEYKQQAKVECAPYSCLTCHLQCLRKLQEGKLTIKN